MNLDNRRDEGRILLFLGLERGEDTRLVQGKIWKESESGTLKEIGANSSK
jgi:hypothetical protein